MTGEQARLEHETRWIREIAGAPNYSGSNLLVWNADEARISAIVRRDYTYGGPITWVEYGVRTGHGDTECFRWGEYGEMRRLIYSTLAERGNRPAAAALEALGPESDE